MNSRNNEFHENSEKYEKSFKSKLLLNKKMMQLKNSASKDSSVLPKLLVFAIIKKNVLLVKI